MDPLAVACLFPTSFIKITKEEDKKYPEITEREIISEGIWIGTQRWEDIVLGKVAGMGSSQRGWKKYLTAIQNARLQALGLMRPEIRNQMSSYKSGINCLGSWANWNVTAPEDLVVWDNTEDKGKITYNGIHVGYKKGWVVEGDILMHEYCHAMFDVFGAHADNKTRKIDLEQFKRDVLCLLNDRHYAWNSIVRTLKAGVEDGTIGENEQFATIGMAFARNKKLPGYITRHYSKLLKPEIISQCTTASD